MGHGDSEGPRPDGEGGPAVKRINLEELDDDDLVSIGRVATYLGVGETTVRNYDRDGVLRHHSRTPTGHRRYRVGTVREFRASH